MNNNKAIKTLETVNSVILGKQAQMREIMLAILAGGHVLLEDIPGVGKTTAAEAFSHALSLESRRVQFTPDVMPSDLTGFSVYRRDTEKFEYMKGSLFCNLLLADEINRTSPKTQSALLEAMEERRVSVEGVTRELPEPFIVIATENPAGSAGTQRLPESQTDRFMVSLTMGYPDFEHELEMVMTEAEERRTESIAPVTDREELLQMRHEVHEVFIKEEICRYLLTLVCATRSDPYITQGASPRASLALAKMAKAAAWLDGRDYVTPADVTEQFPFVAAHRITISPAARMEGRTKQAVLQNILDSVNLPEIK